MSVLLAVDPGIRKSGASIFVDRKLIAATCVKNPVEKGMGPRECAQMAEAILRWVQRVTGGYFINQLAVEWQRIYSSEGASVGHKGDPNSLMGPVGVACALAALLPSAEVWSGVGHDWKGGVPKPSSTKKPYAIEGKVRSRLVPDEVKSFESEWPKNKEHTWDITDSAGIGMHYLGRFERHRVFARD